MTDLPPLIVSFTIEDEEIHDIHNLNDGLKKKFTSLAKSPVTYTDIYKPTLFRWDFGDGTPIFETVSKVTHHAYQQPGTYLVRHQACNFCTCSDWGMCFQSISVAPSKFNWPVVAFGGLFGLIMLRKDCGNYDTNKECRKESHCQWIPTEKTCARICKEGYRLEKIMSPSKVTPKKQTKTQPKFVCIPIKRIPTNIQQQTIKTVHKTYE